MTEELTIYEMIYGKWESTDGRRMMELTETIMTAVGEMHKLAIMKGEKLPTEDLAEALTVLRRTIQALKVAVERRALAPITRGSGLLTAEEAAERIEGMGASQVRKEKDAIGYTRHGKRGMRFKLADVVRYAKKRNKS